MSGYAVRKDNLGYRAVDNESDITAEEIFSLEIPVFEPTAQQIDEEKKSMLVAYWESIEVEVDSFIFQGGQLNGATMDLAIGQIVDAETYNFPLKYGWADVTKIQLIEAKNKISALLDIKKIELGIV